MGRVFPEAEGKRLPWSALPRRVVSAVEGALGATIVEAVDQPGGFSPGAAARLGLADGGRAFVKAVAPHLNPQTPEMHRTEGRLAMSFPAEAPVPGLLFTHDDGEWIVLGFEDVDGRHPRLPWVRDELDRVLGALSDLVRILTPSPVAAPSLEEKYGPYFSHWRTLAAGGSPVPVGLDPWAVAHLYALADLEARWPEAGRGLTLLHADLRADNILLTEDRVYFIDWPNAAIGAPWVDLLFMLPSVAMQHGPTPDEVFRTHPLGGGAPPVSIEAVLAALTGYFVVGAFAPPPPGLPTVREFQRAQGVQALAWLRARLEWD